MALNALSGLGSLRVLAGQRIRLTRPFTSPSSMLRPKDNTSPRERQEHNKESEERPSIPKNEPPSQAKVKSVSQADKELRERLEQMSGEGGAAGIEYEDGKPNAMKRGVRNNMFRLI